MEMPGWNFEDSEFEEPRDRAQSSGGPYTAKQCEPQWFCDDVNNEELLTVMKFRGDLAYRQEDFQKALSEYSSCSVLLSANAVMRRDVQESQARCLIALGRYDEALEIAEILKKGVSNTDHLTCVLNLQATIYSNIGNLWQSGSCLQQLISLHPFNPWFWKRLAELYGSLFLAVSDCRTVSCGANTCSVCVEKRLVNKHQPMIGEEIHRGDQWHLKQSVRSQDTCDCDDRTTQQRLLNGMEDCGKCSLLQNCTNREELRINSCASFIRASLLLQLIQPQQASFVLEKNLKTQVEIEERLKDFGLREEIRALITEIMEEDLSPERIRDEGQIDLKTTMASTLVVMPSDNEFKEKWFKKICSVLVGDL